RASSSSKRSLISDRFASLPHGTCAKSCCAWSEACSPARFATERFSCEVFLRCFHFRAISFCPTHRRGRTAHLELEASLAPDLPSIVLRGRRGRRIRSPRR